MFFWGAVGHAVSLDDFLKVLSQNNGDLIQARGEYEKAKISSQGYWRLNAPIFSISANRGQNQLESSALPETTIGQDVNAADLSLKGRYVPWGFNYEISQTYYTLNQKPFVDTQSVKQDGRTFSLGVSIDLLEGAGFRVGGVPEQLASAGVKLGQVNLKRVNKQAIKDVINKYLDILLTQKKIQNIQALLRDATQLESSYRRQFSEGLLSQIDQLGAEIQLKELQLTMLRLSTQKKSQMQDLLNVAGTPASFEMNAETQFQEIDPQRIAFDPTKTRTKVGKQNNLEVQSLIAQRKLREVELDELEDRLAPTLQLTGTQSWHKNDPSVGISTEENLSYKQWYVGLKLEFPLDNVGARTDAKIKRMEVTTLNQRQAQLENLFDAKMEELSTRLTNLQTELDRLTEIEKLTSKRFKAVLPLLEKSKRVKLDVFDLQNQLRDQQFLIADLKTSILRVQADILDLAGLPIVSGVGL